MPIQKQPVNISFTGGLDQKTDPYQVEAGKFLALNNSTFDKVGRLTKRNGFGSLPTLPSGTFPYITTFKNNLTAIGTKVCPYVSGTSTWATNGNFSPVELNTRSMIRNNSNQIQVDSVTSAAGITCTAYTQTSDFLTFSFYYSLLDSTTSQSIVAPVALTPTTGTVIGAPRVFLLGSYFIIVFSVNVAGTPHLQYIAVNTSTFVANAAVDIAAYQTARFASANNFDIGTASANGFDGVVASNVLYLAWVPTSGTGININSLSSSLVLGAGASPDTTRTFVSTVGVCADTTGGSPVIWVGYSSSGTGVWALSFNSALTTVTSPVNFASDVPQSITGTAQSSICTFYIDAVRAMPFDATIPNDYIVKAPVPQAGMVVTITIASPGVITTAGAHGLSVGDIVYLSTTGALPTGLATSTPYYVSVVPSSTTFQVSATLGGTSINTSGAQSGVQTYTVETVLLSGFGLATKGFLIGTNSYVTAAFQSPYQDTYFVINSSGQAVSKIAYENGGGYAYGGLASVGVSSSVARFSYLFKDLIQAINKGGTTPSSSTASVFTQTGINQGLLTFNITKIFSCEAGNNLNVSGGFLWAYDGVVPNENDFFVWPEMIFNADGTYKGIATASSTTVTPTGDVTSGSNVIANISSYSGVSAGMSISGTGIPAGTVIVKILATSASATGIQISKNATATNSGVTLTIAGNMSAQIYYYQFVYEWTDNQGNIFRSAPSNPITKTTTGATSTVTIKVPYLNLTYKTANPVKIVGYRWSTAQPIYYQFTSITQPVINFPGSQVATIVDASSDATIQGNSIIYTNGGVVENTSPPACRIMTLFDDRLWLVDDEDKNLLWFSKQIIENTPVEMSDLFTFFVAPTIAGQGSTGEMVALGNMDDKLIIFKEKGAAYYINGVGPDNTGANNQYSQPVFITATVGQVLQKSISVIPDGLIFKSNLGFWLLTRKLETVYIGAAVEDYNQYEVTSSTTTPENNQVRFTLSNGTILFYDYYVGQWGTFSSAGLPVTYASIIYNDLHTIISSASVVLQETVGTYLDVATPVLQSFTTAWIKLMGLRGYQRSYFFYLLGTYLSSQNLQIDICFDYNSTIAQTNTFVPSLSANQIEDFRCFLRNQKCESFRVSITEVLGSGDSAGAGLTISGLNLNVGIKKGYAPIQSSKSVG